MKPPRQPKARPKVSAKAKAVDFLSRREHSRLELQQKLSARGFNPDEIKEAIDWAKAQGFQSDDRFRVSLFRRRATTYGDRAIEMELDQHKLALSASSQLPEEDLPSELERANAWLQRRYSSKLSALSSVSESGNPELLSLKAKAFRALSSRGFQFHNIEKAWQALIADHSDNA